MTVTLVEAESALPIHSHLSLTPLCVVRARIAPPWWSGSKRGADLFLASSFKADITKTFHVTDSVPVTLE